MCCALPVHCGYLRNYMQNVYAVPMMRADWVSVWAAVNTLTSEQRLRHRQMVEVLARLLESDLIADRRGAKV